ncbi:amino acid ABC transporter substrate-binding protein [Algihabitans albus]|uniref:amino acid ABC transporter substrate-binding protein n=1 Tax=Algihabitans albus TaxID=2164067 RepID=UPI0035CEF1B1
MNLIKLMTTAAAVGVLTAGAASAQTLDAVKQRGAVQCGVTTGLAGFAAPNDVGEWEGFDVDFCRAMAAAVFGDPDMVNYTPTTAKERFTALQSGEIDLLARNTTWTFSRDVNLGFEFVGINYYDGQGFMVRTDLGVDSALELDGASVCIQTGTTTELNLADYFRTNGMSFEPVTVDTADQAREAYEAARCDVYTTDASGLAAQRSSMSDPSAHKILPEIISKEPLGPLVRHGDNQWGDIARWVLNAMVTAEELGVTSENASDMTDSENPEIRRLLGSEGELGAMLGLSNDFAYNVITMVGNYSEVYENNIGVDTPLGLERGLNALWNDGGVLYSPPFR